MMTAFPYVQLLQKAQTLQLPCVQVSEAKARYLCLKERHLQAMWLEQKYFKNLTTKEGQPITVVSPGVWNSEAGPDFLHAHLKIGDQELRGDIELHLAEEGWYEHGHHHDPRYNSVILHIAYWQPKIERTIITAQDKKIAQTYLEHNLTISETRILRLIDLDLYPYKHFAGTGQCARSLFLKLSEQRLQQFFRSAAAWRCIQKKEHLEAVVGESSDLALAGMAMALGYKHNASPFLSLFLHLQPFPDFKENVLFACLLGAAGFFTEYYRQKWEASTYYQELLHLYTSAANPSPGLQVPLTLDKVRPANHPVRRLALLAKLIKGQTSTSLTQKIIAFWEGSWVGVPAKKWGPVWKEFLTLLPAYRDEYWEFHYTFEKEPQTERVQLLGEEVKREICINVCLPIIGEVVENRGNPVEIEAFHHFYAALPGGKAKKALYLIHRFFGESDSGQLLRRAEMQQGAFQLHRDFCVHYEASCVGCPFVQSYHTSFE